MYDENISNAACIKTTRRPLTHFVLTTALALLVFQQAAPAQTQVSLKSAIAIPNKRLTGFDISWVDEDSRVYLLAANPQVVLVDLNTNTASTISGFNTNADPNVSRSELNGPNGVATVNHIEAWAGDGPTLKTPVVVSSNPAIAYAGDNCDSSVKVINLVTKKITDTINTGGCFRADELAFDPVDQVFLVANPGEGNIGKSNFITLISTQPVLAGQHHQILKKIVFDGTNGTPNSSGGIEQSVYSPDTGLFYIVASNGANDAVAVIDPRDPDSIGVVQLYPISNCGATGASLKKYTLFVGCGGGPVQFVDIRDGNILGTVQQVSGVDEVWYDAGNNLFVTTSFPPDSTIYTIDGTTLKLSQSIPVTGIQGAMHSAASDYVTKQIFIPVPAGGSVCGPAPNTGCIAVFAH